MRNEHSSLRVGYYSYLILKSQSVLFEFQNHNDFLINIRITTLAPYIPRFAYTIFYIFLAHFVLFFFEQLSQAVNTQSNAEFTL